MRQESTIDSGHGLHLGGSFDGVRRRGSTVNKRKHRASFQPAKAIANIPRRVLIGILLVIALLAFEMFNFDSTQYALSDFLAETSFMRIRWATILAVAFCAIDFAGLAYLFGTGQEDGKNKEVWYLMGAWLLGATMNALMTWWAVSVTLLSHDLGNEVLSRSELLNIVPIFVAILVWLTRILFIGAFSIAGNRLFELDIESKADDQRPATAVSNNKTRPAGSRPVPARPAMAAQGRRR
jgi:hypothetical protein